MNSKFEHILNLFHFLERKKHVLVILIRIKGHIYNHPVIGLHIVTAHRSSTRGKGLSTAKDPIRKLSHHERTAISSTSNECQKELISILKVSTHTKQYTAEEKSPFNNLRRADNYPEKPIGSQKIP